MIRISPIRLIDQDDQQVGVVEVNEAKRLARVAELDLVEISPDTRPPVCKIMDYGKFKYEQSKKDQRNRAASKQSEMKEVRLGRSIKIDPHDVQIRVERARKFLMDGHKVLLVQQFRGREMQHRRLGMNRLHEIVETLSDIAKVETPPRQAGRRLSLILSPDRAKLQAIRSKVEQTSRANAKAAALEDKVTPDAELAAPAPPEPQEALEQPTDQQQDPQPTSVARGEA